MGFNSLPFQGRGLSFPMRLNRNTGGAQVSEGFSEVVSVAVAYIQEKYTINQPAEETRNHIAEAIYHILFTNLREHETLPAFGSKVQQILFEPSSIEARLIFQSYLSWSSDRWEKRAKYPEGGIQWFATGLATDRGELPVKAVVEFITQQSPKNLVAPFVTVRQARLQEYPASVVDSNKHDLVSRYYKQASYVTSDKVNSFLRIKKNIDIPPAPDDSFYKVKPTDTWMLIADKELRDVRNWFYPYLCFVQDRAKAGATREILNPNIEPPIGETIRLPSVERILLINSRR